MRSFHPSPHASTHEPIAFAVTRGTVCCSPQGAQEPGGSGSPACAAGCCLSCEPDLACRVLPSDCRNQCAPAVERYTAARKRSWARKVVAGQPVLPGYQDLFNAGVYEEGAETLPASEDDDQTIMGCTPISTSTIQNNTCVLSPVVTQGPYFHEAGHPIRQNIAETQDGLLLVGGVSPGFAFLPLNYILAP
jgi:hypothetical protein